MTRRVAGALAWVPALALAAPAARLDVPLERYRLPNGLTVILHEDHRVPTVVVDLWFAVGSKDEKKGATGFAHLFEHLMFMGTQNVPNGQFDGVMESAGGQNNASTSEDRTNYYESGPSNLLETFLWLESDRLAHLPDDMTPAKVDLQRDVVKNERRQSYENRPYGQVELVLPEHMFPEGHPYHHPVIGSHQDLTAATADDVKAFFKTFYVPSNASLVVSGDFQGPAAKKLVDRYFGWMPKVPLPPHAKAAPGKLAAAERVVLEDQVTLEQVTMAWHSPPAFTPGDAEADVLAALLGLGQSSRLYRLLVHDLKLAESVRVEQRSMQGTSLWVIVATLQPGRHAEELEKAIDGELKRLLDKPAGEAEVSRARALIETDRLYRLEDPIGIADSLNEFQFYLGDPALIRDRLLGRYDAVTAALLAGRAKEILGAPHLTLAVVPKKGDKP